LTNGCKLLVLNLTTNIAPGRDELRESIYVMHLTLQVDSKPLL